jgi:hypothetical protein
MAPSSGSAGMSRRIILVDGRNDMKTVSVECPWRLRQIAANFAHLPHPVGGGPGGHTLRRPPLYLITRVWDVD